MYFFPLTFKLNLLTPIFEVAFQFSGFIYHINQSFVFFCLFILGGRALSSISYKADLVVMISLNFSLGKSLSDSLQISIFFRVSFRVLFPLLVSCSLDFFFFIFGSLHWYLHIWVSGLLFQILYINFSRERPTHVNIAWRYWTGQLVASMDPWGGGTCSEGI